MKTNMGTTDRWIRIILGLGLILLFFITTGPIKYVAIVGIVFVFTALIKWCPLYTLFGIKTCKR